MAVKFLLSFLNIIYMSSKIEIARYLEMSIAKIHSFSCNFNLGTVVVASTKKE